MGLNLAWMILIIDAIVFTFWVREGRTVEGGKGRGKKEWEWMVEGEATVLGAASPGTVPQV